MSAKPRRRVGGLIAAAKRDITLSKPLLAHLFAEEVLEEAFFETDCARDKLRVEQSLISTQSAPSCLQSFSSSFQHVLSDMQVSPGADGNCLAQAKVEMEILFNKFLQR